ncbi:MAG: MoaD/ThiS family protein [Sphingomonadales bacterium]|nr:MoaD/ThiS family protein [Sphingomonadales bacterium]
MNVFIPDALLSYTGSGEVEAGGASIGELFVDLDRRYPGLRFRVIDEQDRFRRHMRVFVNGIQTFDLGMALTPGDEIAIIQALSGG